VTRARSPRLGHDAGTDGSRPGCVGTPGGHIVRRRDRRAHARRRLVGDAARPTRTLAFEPVRRPRRLPQLGSPHDDLVGARAGDAVQRRVPSDTRHTEAPARPGPTRTRVLARRLERHRTDARGRAVAGRGDLRRRPAPSARPARASRGGLLHAVVRPHPGRDGSCARRLHHRRRDHATRAGRASVAHPARPRATRGGDADDRAGVRERHPHARRQPG